jgi:uncharacterized membrane protein
LHLLGAAVWVGSQVFVLGVVVPMLRSLDDRAARLRVVRIMTRNFGWLGGAALVLQVATGFWLLGVKTADGFEIRDFRYGTVLDVKLAMVTLTIALTAIHTFVLGPRMLRIMGDGTRALTQDEEARLRRLRKQSGILSAANLVLAILILAAAATLTSSWAHVPA